MEKIKQAFTIIEKDGEEKNQWVKIGIAFVNRDQSLNIRLDALPVNGLIHVRDIPKKKESKREESNSL